MKTLTYISIVMCSLLYAGCISFPKATEYYVLPQASVQYGITIGQVKVSKDLIEDKELQNQMRNIAGSMFARYIDTSDTEKLRLEIEVGQRSYYQNISEYNSIYMQYKLYNEKGECVLNNSYIQKTTDSIDSAKMEYNLLSVVRKAVERYIRGSAENKK